MGRGKEDSGTSDLEARDKDLLKGGGGAEEPQTKTNCFSHTKTSCQDMSGGRLVIGQGTPCHAAARTNRAALLTQTSNIIILCVHRAVHLVHMHYREQKMGLG
jgi:hypothetical protein